MTRRKRDPVYEPSAEITLTHVGPWQDSVSNPGSFYRELHCDCEHHSLRGRSYVDVTMKNYTARGWPTLIELLERGCVIRATAALRQNSQGSLYVDVDHVTAHTVISPEGESWRITS